MKNEIKLKLNDLKLNGASFETKDDYYLNVVNASDAILLILQLSSAFAHK